MRLPSILGRRAGKGGLGPGNFFEDKKPGMFDDPISEGHDVMTSGGTRANWAHTGTGNWAWSDPTGKQPEPPVQPHPLDM